MAKYTPGEAFGSVTGKLYRAVAAVVNGIHTLRALPSKSSKGPSDAQKASRKRMAATVAAIRPFLNTLRNGFLRPNMIPWALAVKANFQMLSETADGGYVILPQDIQLSNGAKQFDVKVLRNADSIELSWAVPATTNDLYGGSLFVAVHNPSNGYVAEFSSPLSAGEINLTVDSLGATEGDNLNFYSFAATSLRSSLTAYQLI